MLLLHMLAFILVASASAISDATADFALPPPARLMVEGLLAPKKGEVLTLSTRTPRFSFLPHLAMNHPGDGVTMEAYRIVVTASLDTGVAGAAPAWDSGKVLATSAVHVKATTNLTSLTAYTWTAQWWSSEESAPSAITSSTFYVGPVTEADWGSSQWVGAGGQTEFKYTFETASLAHATTGATSNAAAAGSAVANSPATLFVSAPGGSVVYANGIAVSDECGIAAWINNDENMPYSGFDLTPFLLSTLSPQTQTITISVGSGFTSSSIWKGPPSNTNVVARMLLVDSAGKQVTSAQLVGRAGKVVSADPFHGGIFNMTVDDGEGWASTMTHHRATAAASSAALATLGTLRASAPFPTPRAFAVPSAQTAPAAAAALRSTVVGVSALPPAPAPRRCAGPCSPTHPEFNATFCYNTAPADGGCDPLTKPRKRWHYAFDRNIVGVAGINTGAFKLNCAGSASVDARAESGGISTSACTGEITLQYCEVYNNTNYTMGLSSALCGPLAGLAVVADTFIVDEKTAAATPLLKPSFTWHGFQHVIVTVSDSVEFTAAPDALTAEWTAMNAEASGAITFGGGKDAATLNNIMAITQAGQLGNMAAYVPTDCPTREKHAWLGDALDVAEQTMYNFWVTPMQELFLDTIRSLMLTGGESDGNIPVNVPAGESPHPMDISWTAAYPLIAQWLLQYYGDLDAVREHWPTLKRYVDGQKRQMVAKSQSPTAVPNFFNFGDWCAIEDRTTCTKNTGPPAAAANYILAVESMIKMADALGEMDDAKKYAAELSASRAAYHATYYNSTLTSYGKTALEVQSMSTVSIGAGAVPNAKIGSVQKALVADIQSRGTHLTVGATGQKWLLRTLSDTGAAEHDVALALASQTTFPSWGYWISQGATTCWESWTGVQDASHPGNANNKINPPTHNHIFLCGGVGEWMYRSLGGIAPLTAGYATVRIAPMISATADPSSANASVTTVRGVVTSNWKRHTNTAATAAEGEGEGEGEREGEGKGKADAERRCASASSSGGQLLVTLQVSVPVGMTSSIHVPLLGNDPANVVISEVSMKSSVHQVWPPLRPSSSVGGDDVATKPAWLVAKGRVDNGSVGRTIVVGTTSAKMLTFEVRRKCSSRAVKV